MNSERRIQRVRRVVTPMGHSRPDWEIICAVARAMEKADAFAYRRRRPSGTKCEQYGTAGRGISYARIEDEGLQWPCPSEDHPGTDILHRDSFAGGTRARLRAIEFATDPGGDDPEFPLFLTTGRTLHQFNAGTMTGRTANTVLRPTDLLEMAPADATRLSLHDGEKVRLVGRYGAAVLPLQISGRIKPGELFATFHTSTVFLNHVIGPSRNRFTGTPEYKVTAVRVEPESGPREPA